VNFLKEKEHVYKNGEFYSTNYACDYVVESIFQSCPETSPLDVYDEVYSFLIQNGKEVDKERLMSLGLCFPSVINDVDGDMYFSMHSCKAFMETMDRYTSILSYAGVTHEELLSNVYKPVNRVDEMDIILDKYRTISVIPGVNGIVMYLHSEYTYLFESEWRNTISALGESADEHGEFLTSIFRQDMGFILNNKIDGIAFGYAGGDIVGRINYYAYLHNLTDRDLEQIEEVIGPHPVSNPIMISLATQSGKLERFKHYVPLS
jgi:hypothetical protein